MRHAAAGRTYHAATDRPGARPSQPKPSICPGASSDCLSRNKSRRTGPAFSVARRHAQPEQRRVWAISIPALHQSRVGGISPGGDGTSDRSTRKATSMIVTCCKNDAATVHSHPHSNDRLRPDLLIALVPRPRACCGVTVGPQREPCGAGRRRRSRRCRSGLCRPRAPVPCRAHAQAGPCRSAQR